jgi:hypothetical protein
VLFSNWRVDLGRGGGSRRPWRIMDMTERVLLVLAFASVMGASAVGDSGEVGEAGEVGEVGEVGDMGEVGEDGGEGAYCTTPLNVSSGTKNGTALSSLGITLGYVKLSKKSSSESTNFEYELEFDFIAAAAAAPGMETTDEALDEKGEE